MWTAVFDIVNLYKYLLHYSVSKLLSKMNAPIYVKDASVDAVKLYTHNTHTDSHNHQHTGIAWVPCRCSCAVPLKYQH